MDLQIRGIDNKLIDAEITISGSKSESNRLLILQKLFSDIDIENLSNSDDTNHLIAALKSEKEEINIGHAGTAMRFLTAFFAAQKGRTLVLSGSDRMHNRPIEILVNALRDLGAEISYLEKKGYPPLQITGKELTHDFVKINGNVSSQYISALLLIASSLKKGLTIELLGEITSIPYIKMTLRLLQQIGIVTYFMGNKIQIEPIKQSSSQEVVVESDWSSASYYFSIIALSEIGSKIKLSSYKKQSLQGDSILSEIYKSLGVATEFSENSIVLIKTSNPIQNQIELDLNKAPDIAQTIAVTCFGLGVSCDLKGLHTLKIKETDRLEALQLELTKLGAEVSITQNSLHLKSSNKINSNISIETYNDHRMAMSFAPLAMLVPIKVLDANVVTKSYHNFWKDLEKVGFQLLQ